MQPRRLFSVTLLFFTLQHREALATPLSRRIRVVGVMGSGEHTHERLARPLGAWIAHAGFHLLTGGAGASMAAVASAFTEVQPRRGLSIGVLPCISADDHLPKVWWGKEKREENGTRERERDRATQWETV